MTDVNVDCGHCITFTDRCSDESDRNCYQGYVVTDDARNYAPGQQIKVLGEFDTEHEAALFIETLPNYLDGNYGLDGPADD